MLWNYELEEIEKGFQEQPDKFCCLICDAHYQKGRVYEEQGILYDASGAINQHIKEKHGSVADYLVHQESGVTGLSDIHRSVIACMLLGKSDREIAQELGIAASTVRNHRFKLREKEKQAKMFLALMISLEKETKKSIKTSDGGDLEELHPNATMVDDRYDITDQEQKKTVATYMDSTGRLKQIPAKAKKKIIILREIMKNFKADKEYTEKEVDRLLKRIYEEDYASIRRALIEYGFMDRSMDGRIYRVKE
ncbi:MAG: hypothetical protein PWP24_88 [Clostridiales bacterium]|nr:hypothetical protein [Clostridiales bacterium]